MVHSILRVPRRAWLLQTAAAGALGRMIIRLGQRDGFRTINVVRRREHAEQVRRDGGDEVICTGDGESIEERVQAITGRHGVRYAVDAVGGGETSAAVVRALAPGGRMLVYGVLAGEPLRLDPNELMLGQKSVEGFWMTEWSLALSPWKIVPLFRRIGRLFRAGVFHSEVEASYGLDEVRAAVRRAGESGRQGKILLRMDSAR